MNISFESLDSFWIALMAEKSRIGEDLTSIYVTDGHTFNIQKLPSFVFSALFPNVTLYYSEYYNGNWQVGAEKIIQERLQYWRKKNNSHYVFVRAYDIQNKDEIIAKQLMNVICDANKEIK